MPVGSQLYAYAVEYMQKYETPGRAALMPAAKATTVVSEVVVMQGPLSRSDLEKRSAMLPSFGRRPRGAAGVATRHCRPH